MDNMLISNLKWLNLNHSQEESLRKVCLEEPLGSEFGWEIPRMHLSAAVFTPSLAYAPAYAGIQHWGISTDPQQFPDLGHKGVKFNKTR